MRRQTSTRQIQKAIKDNLLILKKTELYNKTTKETETVPNDKFLEYFDFFCESGIFMDAIGWHYERDHRTDDYIIETGRVNGDSDVIITAYLRMDDSTTEEEIEKILLFEELED